MYLNKLAHMESVLKQGMILDYSIVSEADGTITTEIKAQPPAPTRIVINEKNFAGYYQITSDEPAQWELEAGPKIRSEPNQACG